MAGEGLLSWKIRSQISRFSNKIGEGFGKVKRRFISEMIFGIQACKDVKISQISRSLNEDIKLIKTEERLCRNLSDSDLTESINRWTCWEGGGQVERDTVLAVDLGDVRKRYAKKMENLGGIRDGSLGEFGKGYWLCEVVGAHPYGDKIIPLYGELYAQNADDYRSENDQILKAIYAVSEATEGRGIFAIDRGGDRSRLINPLIDKDLRFVIRQSGKRRVIVAGRGKLSVKEASRHCAKGVDLEVEIEREGDRERKRLHISGMEARLPDRPQTPVWIVSITGLGPNPVLLLTNVAPERGYNHFAWIADVYLTRWKCEEAYRFVKQSYSLEDVRVRSYIGLRNIYAFVHAIFYFVSVVIGQKAKLNLILKKVCEKAKRFFEVPSFFQYAVADGICRLLFASSSRVKKEPPPDDGQLVMEFMKPPP